MKNPVDKCRLLVTATTGKWVLIGVLLAGLARIVWAIMKGKDISDAIGIASIGMALALTIHLLFHKMGYRK